MPEQTQLAEQQTTALSAKDTWANLISTNLDKINDALPSDLNKARFVQNAMSMLTDNTDLMKNEDTKNQIVPVLMRGAVLGLDYTNKEWYPVKYGKKLEFQMSYRGAEKLARKYSIKPIKSIIADVVRDGDEFQSSIENNNAVVNFKPKPFNQSEIIGAFAFVTFTDNTAVVETMNKDEIETVRSKSKMGNAGAWKDFYPEMAKKSVIKRLMKRIEIDFENTTQAEYYNDDEAIAQTPEEVIDVSQMEIEENANSIPFDEEG